MTETAFAAAFATVRLNVASVDADYPWATLELFRDLAERANASVEGVPFFSTDHAARPIGHALYFEVEGNDLWTVARIERAVVAHFKRKTAEGGKPWHAEAMFDGSSGELRLTACILTDLSRGVLSQAALDLRQSSAS